MKLYAAFGIFTASVGILLSSCCDCPDDMWNPNKNCYWTCVDAGKTKPRGEVPENPTDCCEETIGQLVSGTAPVGGGSYWIALARNDSIMKLGSAVYVPAGPFTDLPLELSYSYADGLEGEYQVKVYGTVSDGAVGKLADAFITYEGGEMHAQEFVEEVCRDCCTPSYRYSGLRKTVQNSVGAEARITARYGLPCRYPTDSSYAHGSSWVGLEKNINSTQGDFLVWAQTGVGFIRSIGENGNNGTYRTVHTETMDDNGHNIDHYYSYTPGNLHPPDEGTSQIYKVYLDQITGTWIFTVGTNEFGTATSDFWKQEVCDYADWTGEIYNYEDDMPGRVDGKCVFEDMKVQRGQSGMSTVLFEATDELFPRSGSRDSQAFGVERPFSDRLEIWDKKPRVQ